MRLSYGLLLLSITTNTASSFVVIVPPRAKATARYGYLDDLSKELKGPDANPNLEEESKEATNLKKENLDRYGVGDWNSYVEFDEFDGGDGQMGVAGDGKKGLDKIGSDVTSHLAKSKVMSAKNAWGKSTGYADTLIDQGMEATRAQQIENWKNQQELSSLRKENSYMTDEFDRVSDDVNWRSLASFGVERNQDFDLDQAFGPVTAGSTVDGVLELKSPMGQPSIQEIALKNEYMGFADFRAAFTPETPPEFSVEPTEGSISQREATNFIVRFRAQRPGVVEGYLVIETEDFKKTYKVIGGTA